MEFKVRELTGVSEKSVAEVEQELLDKHEQSLNGGLDDNSQTETIETTETIEAPIELKEEDVLSYIGKRYNKEINSFDELMAARESNDGWS